MYLVVIRGPCDDLPLRLCGTRAEAEAFGNTVSTRDVKAASAVFSGGISDPADAYVDIVEFREGVPVRCTNLRHGVVEEAPFAREPAVR